MSISGKAVIAGIGATDFSKNSGRSELRLAAEAVADALNDAGLSPKDVDGLVTFTMDSNLETAVARSTGIGELKFFSQIGYGGGTCQSSSTLYNTVRQLPGITVLMRRPHGPGCARYLPMHQDAAVGNESLNFIFRNDYGFPIRILAQSTGEGVITIQIFRAD